MPTFPRRSSDAPLLVMIVSGREAGAVIKLAESLDLEALMLTSITLKVKRHARLGSESSSDSGRFSQQQKQARGSERLCGLIGFKNKSTSESCFPSLGAAGGEGQRGKQALPFPPAGRRWAHAAQHRIGQPSTVPRPTPRPSSTPGRRTALAAGGGEPGGEGFAYFVSSSLSFSASCLSSSFSPSFSFSFSFSSFSSWLLRGICCCCCKTRDAKQNKPQRRGR